MNINEKISSFTKNGYIVLEDAIGMDEIKLLKSRFNFLMGQKIKKLGLIPSKRKKIENSDYKINFQPEGGNHDLNRWNMHLPSEELFLSENIINNTKVMEILNPIIGEKIGVFLIASDTPFPGSGVQNIHQDFQRFGITVNIPLTDFTELNAPLEIWPGTHIKQNRLGLANAFTKLNQNLSNEEIEDYLQNIPSKRILLKAGSILIRDQRLLHRGTANFSDESRPCLSIWYKSLDTINFKTLTLPTPYSSVIDLSTFVSEKIRRFGIGQNKIQSKVLLNLGSLLGRIVDEIGGSDRNYKRPISYDDWQTLSKDSKHLLRYAKISGLNKFDYKRSFFSSIILLLTTFVFLLICFPIILYIQSKSSNRQYSIRRNKSQIVKN